MRIIKEGFVGDRLHRATCPHCGCEFEFAEKEATRQTDYQGTNLVISCPRARCNKTIYKRLVEKGP
jgi:hypothetical protein